MKPVHLVLALLVAAAWGINFVVIDIGLETFPPLLFTALRFTVAAVPAVFFVGRPQVALRWVIAVGMVMGALQFGLLFVGIHAGMPAGLTSLVVQSQVLFTAVFSAVLLRERPTGGQWIGMAIAFGGMGLVAVDYGTGSPILAFLLVLGAAASWGLGNIATRKAAPPDAFRFMVWVSVVPVLPLLLLSALTEGVGADLESLRHLTPSALGSVAYVAWISTVFGFGVWAVLIRRYGANTVAPYSLLVPVFGMTSAALLLNERLTPLRCVAAVVVIVGVAVTTLARRRSAQSDPIGDDRLVRVV